MAKPQTLELWMDAKPQAVYDVLANLDLVQTWHPSVTSVKRLDDGGKLKEGSTWIESRTGPDGRAFVGTIKVTEAKPAQRFAIHVSGKMMEMDAGFTLADLKGGTRVEYLGELQPKGIGRLFAGKMRKTVEHVDGDLLQRLCSAVEANAKPSTKAAKSAKPAAPAKGKAAKKR